MRKIGESIKEERIKFKKGLQTKFLEEIKDRSGLSWEILAKELNICTNTLSFFWRNEKSTIPVSFARKLLELGPFKKWENIEKDWIEKILSKNWGQDLSGEKNKKEIMVPKYSVDLAEFFGVILGDGHLTRKTLILAGNSFEESHYVYLSKKVKVLFGIGSKIFKIKDQNSMQLRVNSTELIKFLINQGFVLGDKIKNKESLPRWIFKDKKFVYGALRGMFDTDGGIYQKQKGYKRAVIEFQTKSPYIRKDLFELIEKGGFKPSKSDGNVRIQNQEEVLRFFQLIGSANPKNIIRFNYFIQTGGIPLKEKLNKEITLLKIEKPFKAALI